MRKLINIVNSYLVFIAIILVFVFWEIVIRLNNIPNYILPSPIQIGTTIVDIYPLLIKHTASTIQIVAYGFALAVVIALVVAFILENIPVLKKSITPLIIVSQTIPIITLAPLFLIWFGYGMLPKILVVILVCFFPIVINLLKAFEAVDKDLINLFRSMGASKLAIFRMVKVPQAIPALFSGLKISATYSVMAAIIGEWLGAKQGLGYFMTLSYKSFYTDRVFAAIIVVSLTSLLLVKLVDLLEWLFVPWNRPNKKIYE